MLPTTVQFAGFCKVDAIGFVTNNDTICDIFGRSNWVALIVFMRTVSWLLAS